MIARLLFWVQLMNVNLRIINDSSPPVSQTRFSSAAPPIFAILGEMVERARFQVVGEADRGLVSGQFERRAKVVSDSRSSSQSGGRDSVSPFPEVQRHLSRALRVIIVLFRRFHAHRLIILFRVVDGTFDRNIPAAVRAAAATAASPVAAAPPSALRRRCRLLVLESWVVVVVVFAERNWQQNYVVAKERPRVRTGDFRAWRRYDDDVALSFAGAPDDDAFRRCVRFRFHFHVSRDRR